MAKLKVVLKRNLRRSILRGQPWVYRDSIEVPGGVKQASLCQVVDAKGSLGWGLYDPHGPLSLRMISPESRTPPNEKEYEARFARAWGLRSRLPNEGTTAFRLWNGEGDGLPGLVCDLYNGVGVLQFDGQGPREFWDRELAARWLIESGLCRSVVEKARRNSSERGLELVQGAPVEGEVEIQENGVRFLVDLEKGQKTGFFLDQRENRKDLSRWVSGKRVLNLFSYTGGFSIYAGQGGAKQVVSVDLAKPAIETCQRNWELNGLPREAHRGVAADVFEFLESEGKIWDHIIVDPPSMGHSEEDRARAKAKYIDVFGKATAKVVEHGSISFSSCSSHINFNDFAEIITEALSSARRRGRILRVSGQGADHPFPEGCPQMRYLKYVHVNLD